MQNLILVSLIVCLGGCSALNTAGDKFYNWEYQQGVPASHGTHQLVGSWYGQPYDKMSSWASAPSPHYCQYDNGVIMEAGFKLCPWTI